MKKYTFERPITKSHYEADAFALRCFDNRYWGQFKDFVANKGLKELDTSSVAGGAKIFASPEKINDQDFMLRELEKSILLHKTKKIMLFTHHDCGAYGGFAKFNQNLDLEFNFHINELNKAASLIKTKFSNVKIETYFMDKIGIIEV